MYNEDGLLYRPVLFFMWVLAEDLLLVNSFEPLTDKVVRLTNQVKKYKLDGLEVYSNMSGDEKLNVFPRVEFFTEMRKAFSKHGLLLSIAIRIEEHGILSRVNVTLNYVFIG